MELSYFLAQLFGLTFIISGGILLIKPTIYAGVVRDFNRNQFVVLLASFTGIIGGLAIVLSHCVFEWSWRLIITLLGWATLLKGVMYLVAPATILKTADAIIDSHGRRNIILILLILLGAYLTYKGFGY